ncbi:hypothetical protein HDU80_003025, partial [Chytriomyces hyalinus]
RGKDCPTLPGKYKAEPKSLKRQAEPDSGTEEAAATRKKLKAAKRKLKTLEKKLKMKSCEPVVDKKKDSSDEESDSDAEDTATKGHPKDAQSPWSIRDRLADVSAPMETNSESTSNPNDVELLLMDDDTEMEIPKVKKLKSKSRNETKTTVDSGAQVHGYRLPLPYGAKIIDIQKATNKSVIGVGEARVQVQSIAHIIQRINGMNFDLKKVRMIEILTENLFSVGTMLDDQGGRIQVESKAMYYSKAPYKKWIQIAERQEGGEYELLPPDRVKQSCTLKEILAEAENPKLGGTLLKKTKETVEELVEEMTKLKTPGTSIGDVADHNMESLVGKQLDDALKPCDITVLVVQEER